MEIQKLVCDRCGKSAETAIDRTGWNQLTVMLVPDGLLLSTDGVTKMHACPTCTSVLAAFVPAEARATFYALHARHEETFDIVAKSTLRVAAGEHAELTERRPHAFKIRRLALLVARPEDWVVTQIYVGNRVQLMTPRNVYYTIKGSEIGNRDLTAEIAPVGDLMDLRITVTYLGKNPEGGEWKGVRVTAIVPGTAEPSVGTAVT